MASSFLLYFDDADVIFSHDFQRSEQCVDLHPDLHL